MGLIQTITKSTLKDSILFHSKSEQDIPLIERIEKIKKTQLVISLPNAEEMPLYTLFFDFKPQRKLTINEVITDKIDIYGKKQHTPEQLKKIIVNVSEFYNQNVGQTRLLIEPDEVSANGKEIKKLRIFLLNGSNKVKTLTFDEILPNM